MEEEIVLDFLRVIEPRQSPKKLLTSATKFFHERFGAVKTTFSSLDVKVEFGKEPIGKEKELDVKCADGRFLFFFKKSFSEKDVRFLISLLEKFLEYSLTLRESKNFATTDRLTRLYNKAYFMGILRNALNSGGVFSLVMLDLDYFKRFNDRYGHQAGDGLLKRVGEVLNQNLKSCGFGNHGCRYGGEEFCLLFNLDVESVIDIVEKIREEINKINGIVTVSAGIAGYEPSNSISFYKLVKYADKALYEAKRRGRNRAIIVRF